MKPVTSWPVLSNQLQVTLQAAPPNLAEIVPLSYGLRRRIRETAVFVEAITAGFETWILPSGCFSGGLGYRRSGGRIAISR